MKKFIIAWQFTESGNTEFCTGSNWSQSRKLALPMTKVEIDRRMKHLQPRIPNNTYFFWLEEVEE